MREGRKDISILHNHIAIASVLHCIELYKERELILIVCVWERKEKKKENKIRLLHTLLAEKIKSEL